VRALTLATPVRLAFLELMQPDLDTAADDLVAAGVDTIRIAPIFFGQGGHLRRDLPARVEALRAKHRGTTFACGPAAGEDGDVLDALARFCLRCLDGKLSAARAELQIKRTMTLIQAVSRFLDAPRRVAVLLGLACVGLVGASFFVQHVLDVEPCPLCILQRFTYLALIPVFFAAAVVRRSGRAQRALFGGAALLTLGGLGVAGYQTYLQLFPPPLAGCTASLSYMLDTMAVTEVLGQMLHAGGDCSDTSFKVLGLTMAQASVLIFSTFAVLLASLLLRRRTRDEHSDRGHDLEGRADDVNAEMRVR
jgi:disulfide bond formation protein DsbB